MRAGTRRAASAVKTAAQGRSTIMASGMPALLSHGPKNLSLGERAADSATGLSLAAAAAKPRPNPLLNIVALAAGSYLAWTGAQGRCPVKRLFVDDRKPVAGPEACR